MNILILGGTGMLGPWVVKSLKDKHNILLTDIKEPPNSYDGDFLKLSVDNLDGVIKAAEGMDCIGYLSVLRTYSTLAFDGSSNGSYSLLEAARFNNDLKENLGSNFAYKLAI